MKITIDPVTRIEGHAKVSIYLDEDGSPKDATFHVTQFRGFEKFCEGRPFTEMPKLMARTCGICPVSHLIAAAKACDEIMSVKVPPAAISIRKLINYAQILQSHALSFFYLSSPDFVFGFDAEPEKRNIVGVAEKDPKLAIYGIELRKFGQQIIGHLGGKRVHPECIIPGGVSTTLDKGFAASVLEKTYQLIEKILYGLDFFKNAISHFKDEITSFSHFDSYHLAIGNGKNVEYYDGNLRVIDAGGSVVIENGPPSRYKEIIAEKVEDESYLKSPYLKVFGCENGVYRVGPVSRLNIAERCGTPVADLELEGYRKIAGRIANAAFMNHYARLIEMIHCAEMIKVLLQDDVSFDAHLCATSGVNASEGVGVSEAPRGTFIHHYKVDKNGLVKSANLIIATGHNNIAMNNGVLQVAKHFIRGTDIKEGILNRIEASIRCYDPCLSCSTHAMGKMPVRLTVYNANGEVVREISR
jgi:NAD-reducing hydrogenase large subunit